MNAINTSHDLHLLKIDEKVSDPKCVLLEVTVLGEPIAMNLAGLIT